MDDDDDDLEYDEEHGPRPPREWREIMAMRDPVAVVKIALARHAAFKASVSALEQCPPDAEAARVLVEAHDRGEAPSWLVACLLAFNGHRDGYAKALAILRAGDRRLSEAYASHALVRVAGDGALRDLVDVLESSDDSQVRSAAASALAELRSTEAIDALRAAVSRGRLRAVRLGRMLADVPVPIETMIEDLRSTNRETRRWPALVVHERVRGSAAKPELMRELARCAASSELRDALRAVIDEPGETVFASDARRLREWLGSIAV